MRRVFFSFDWDDVWRVNQVRNSWVTKGHQIAGFVDAAEMETLKRQTGKEIKKWIDAQMKGTSVTCILIGSKTDESKWVKYEIEKSIEQKKGLLGILIHNIKDDKGKIDRRGANLLKDHNGTNFGENVKNALLGGGAGWGLARLVFPQLLIPATIFGAALAVLMPNDDDYRIYDWVEDDGYNNLSNWIEEAAKQVGR
ncbi:MAG: TIR domain-containing protein [Nitrospira sp.]|nr:TIR domain-containing protein [Nitrospira sp.]MDE0404922.1 TIR domain-containing protein [Nitrospira sp.]MDE0506808.1 TIR domain-containing protein [Candidatus Poribacteria bacterium]